MTFDAMKKARPLTVVNLEPALKEHKGNIAAVARQFGVSRGTIYNRIYESVTLREVLSDARETMLDEAESTLYRNALDGDITALIFFLKTQGRTRGYGDQLKVDGNMGLDVNYVNDWRDGNEDTND